MGLTRRFSDWASDLEFEALPRDVLPWVKAAVTDHFTVGLAGSSADGAEIIRNYVTDQYGAGRSSIIGHDIKVSAEGAALLNGTFAHWDEYDDANWLMAGHPSVTIMPALFALGEAENCSGRDFITAYVAGFEVATKLGRLVNPYQIELGWHPTSTLGSLGAAVGASRLLRLSSEQIEVALAIAATQSPGLRANFGTMTKPLHAGLAARTGVLAALLAKNGFTAAQGVLEHSLGFVRALSGGQSKADDKSIDKIGSPLEILTSGVQFKRFPGSFQTHPGQLAMLRIRDEEKVSPEDVESIDVRGNHYMMTYSLIHARPETGLQGRLSLQYTMCAALVFGALDPSHFTQEHVQDSRVRHLIDRFHIESHPELAGLDMTKGEKYFKTEVKVKLKNGRTVERVVWEEDDFSLPAIRNGELAEELLDKFERNARHVLSESARRECLARVRRLEQIGTIAELMEPVSASSN